MSDPQPPSAREERAHRDAIAAFYNTHANRIQNIVARRAKVGHAAAEDACQTAWLILVRRPDITLDARGLKWLIVVATHHAWRAAIPEERPVGGFITVTGDDPAGWQEPPGPASDPLELVIAHELHEERVELLARAKPHEATALYLQAAGYSYKELQKLTDSTHTAINRRLTEGCQRIGASGRDKRRKKRHDE